jgi:hypothetical protein
MPPWENEVAEDPGGGKETGVCGRLGCGDCCLDWKPFRIRVSDWTAGRLGLSLRNDDGPFLQHGDGGVSDPAVMTSSG